MLKRGSLSISTNAIVVLIIAVVMLALILTLVTTGFGLIEDRFFEAISEEQDPASPSGTQHVTINKQNIRAAGGERMGFKFSVLNIQNTPITVDSDAVTIRCSPGQAEGDNNPPFRDEETVFLGGIIAPQEVQTFTYTARLLPGLNSDVYACALSINAVAEGETTSSVRGQANFQITRR